ncbi:hypothetical protein VNO77_03204 [Canavalia gladiata]|uniref:Uncharacterized protein n=1 Tax=Canavalia gladiata TaxID=3824 RepID=A0AAN9RC03_CANGL
MLSRKKKSGETKEEGGGLSFLACKGGAILGRILASNFKKYGFLLGVGAASESSIVVQRSSTQEWLGILKPKEQHQVIQKRHAEEASERSCTAMHNLAHLHACMQPQGSMIIQFHMNCYPVTSAALGRGDTRRVTKIANSGSSMSGLISVILIGASPPPPVMRRLSVAFGGYTIGLPRSRQEGKGFESHQSLFILKPHAAAEHTSTEVDTFEAGAMHALIDEALGHKSGSLVDHEVQKYCVVNTAG